MSQKYQSYLHKQVDKQPFHYPMMHKFTLVSWFQIMFRVESHQSVIHFLKCVSYDLLHNFQMAKCAFVFVVVVEGMEGGWLEDGGVRGVYCKNLVQFIQGNLGKRLSLSAIMKMGVLIP